MEATKILQDHFEGKLVTNFAQAKALLEIDLFNCFAKKVWEINSVRALNLNLSFVILQECGIQNLLFHKSNEHVNGLSQVLIELQQ